jgi:[protein-PII] uridylyltransferase
MMPRIGERLQLSEADVRTLIFLVEEHLSLSKVSQRRDPGEGSILKSLSTKLQTRERLDLLFLLTYCDSISVGHGAYPMWKDALLTELYYGIAQHLPELMIAPNKTVITNAVTADTDTSSEPEKSTSENSTAIDSPSSAPSPSPSVGGALEAQLLAWASSDDYRTLASEHCRRVPRRYLVEVSLEEAILHLDLIQRLRSSNREAVAQVRSTGELLDMWIASIERPKRFSQICGAFLGAGVSVVAAIAYTRNDGLILYRFRVAPGLDATASGPRFWSKLANDVEETLAGKGDFLARIEAARRRIPLHKPITRHVDPEIRVDNTLSGKYTVLDVICGDRIGLLYGLSRALSDLSCEIHFAKIDTNQGLVYDVFYISESGNGGQITDPEKMLNIRRLLKAVASDFQEAKR